MPSITIHADAPITLPSNTDETNIWARACQSLVSGRVRFGGSSAVVGVSPSDCLSDTAGVGAGQGVPVNSMSTSPGSVSAVSSLGVSVPVSVSVPLPPLPEVLVTEDRLAALQVLIVPDDVRAELLADAAHRGTARMVGEAIGAATADVDALWSSLRSDAPTPAAIGALADQIARVTALGEVAARFTPTSVAPAHPAAPMFPESPFNPRHAPAAPPPAAAPRWSNTVSGYVAEVTNLPAPPNASPSRYQTAVLDYERWLLGFGDQSRKPAMPQSTDADLVADEAARDYHQRTTDDRATLTQFADAADQVRAGAVYPLDILAAADHFQAVRVPESRDALQTLNALLADADASRTARGLDT